MDSSTERINFCPRCGKENEEQAYCINCGQLLTENAPGAAMNTGQSGIDRIIPYKNASALIGYYLGVFSLIPCFPIGIVGFFLGLKGLKFAKEHPEAHGRTHAWVGIIAGGLFGFGYLFLTILAFVLNMMG